MFSEISKSQSTLSITVEKENIDILKNDLQVNFYWMNKKCFYDGLYEISIQFFITQIAPKFQNLIIFKKCLCLKKILAMSFKYMRIL